MAAIISNLLTKEQVSAINAKLFSTPFADGNMSGGVLGRELKKNTQVPPNSPHYRELAELIMGAMQKNDAFNTAAIPRRILSPIFSAYAKGDEYKQHVDAASIRGGGAVVSYIRGNIATRTGNLKSAKAHYDDALGLDSAHVKSRLNRCSVNMALDNAKAALDDANVLLEIAPDMMLSKLKRAEASMMLGDWTNAKSDLEEIIEKSPTQYQAMTQLAGCFIALGRPEQAESPLNEALMINQDHAPAWFQRGLLYLDWGKEEAAISDLVTATKVDPNHLDAHLHLAAIHHESERFDQASDAWRAALAIDGEHTVAKKRLEESESAILASI